jgi:hypothetical protein
MDISIRLGSVDVAQVRELSQLFAVAFCDPEVYARAPLVTLISPTYSEKNTL